MLEVSSSALDMSASPSRSFGCGSLQFLPFNSFPFEVGLEVVLVSLLGSTLFTSAVRYLTMEKLARDLGLYRLYQN